MRKIILLMHVSLDGFVGGPKGELDWVTLGEDMWDYVNKITAEADTTLYGGVTFKMMESYWPTAGVQPDATKHDIDYSRWVNSALKIVFSRTIQKTDWQNTKIINDFNPQEIQKFKEQPGKNILMIGSPTIVQLFMQHRLIDEFRLNINPIILGKGKPLFKDISEKLELKLKGTRTFKSGVVGLHYEL